MIFDLELKNLRLDSLIELIESLEKIDENENFKNKKIQFSLNLLYEEFFRRTGKYYYQFKKGYKNEE